MVTFENGNHYEGEWAKDQNGVFVKHGYGIMVSRDGTSINEGYFRNGYMDGKCINIDQHGYFIGYAKDGLYHGQGVLVDKDSKFEGTFIDGNKEGRGTLTLYERYRDDYVIHGFWCQDELDGLSTHISSGVSKDVIYQKGEIIWSIDLDEEEKAPE